jgi:DMSO/TMAO reductase YedYZ molybdopterin-dependent catalytic subunit
MNRNRSAMVVAIVLLAACFVFAQEPTSLVVRGDVLNPGQWSIEELKTKFPKEIQTVNFSSGKDKAQQTGTGIPLFSLIQAAAPKTEKTPKHYDLSFYVYVEARDSYRVYFSLAELNPQIGNAKAWLLWDVDGKPLTGKEAPFRLVVLSDQGHDRFIFGIAGINLVDGTKLATRLAAGQ